LNIWVLPTTRQSYKTDVANNAPTTNTPPNLLAPDSKLYTVQPGDTLWDISRKFEGLTIEKLKTLNNLKSTKLQPGQKLIIG
jgi:membrane-bound lytic murein transglycosylase D